MSAGGGTDAPCTIWQKGVESMRAVRGVVCNTGGFADAGIVTNRCRVLRSEAVEVLYHTVKQLARMLSTIMSL